MLVRWNPMSEFARLFKDSDRRFSMPASRFISRPVVAVRPEVDLYDTGEHLVLKALVPGVAPEDLEVSIEQNTLTIGGRYGFAPSEAEDERVTWYRREIGSGQFSYTVALPVPVEADAIVANVENGVLTLTMPKAEQTKVKRIEVQAPRALADSVSESQRR